jgi:hypothetical protein
MSNLNQKFLDNFITEKDYIQIADVKREKILTDLRLRVLEKLNELSENNPTIKSDKENIQNLKSDTFLFNMIFKLNLDDILNDYKILFNIDENLTKKAIINIIRVNLLREDSNTKENEENLNVKNKIYKSKGGMVPNEVFSESVVKILKGDTHSFIFNSSMKNLFANIIKYNNYEYISLAIETLFSLHNSIDIPPDLVNYLLYLFSIINFFDKFIF